MKTLKMLFPFLLICWVSAYAQTTDIMDNVFGGTGAGASLETDGTGERASGNTLFGRYAGTNITTGRANTGYGYGVLWNLTTGWGNIGIGYLAGQDLTTENHKLYIENGYYPGVGIYGDFSSGEFTVAGSLAITGAIRDTLRLGITSFVPSAVQTISTTESITADASYVRVVSNNGATTLSSVPSISSNSVTDGQLLIIVGTSDTNTLTIQDESNLAGSNVELDSDTDITLGINDTLHIMWAGAVSKWLMISTSDNNDD